MNNDGIQEFGEYVYKETGARLSKEDIEALECIVFDNQERESGKLEPCPCGTVPTELSVCDAGHGGKYATAMGNCCGEWETEFIRSGFGISSKECMDLAIEAWNEAPRGRMTDICDICGGDKEVGKIARTMGYRADIAFAEVRMVTKLLEEEKRRTVLLENALAEIQDLVEPIEIVKILERDCPKALTGLMVLIRKIKDLADRAME